MKKNLMLSFLVFTIIIVSCSNSNEDDNCVSYGAAVIFNVNGPSTGKVNEKINFEVDFYVFNGCGRFGRFVESTSENTRIIEVVAKYVGCTCTQDLPKRTTNYTFQSSISGTYYLKFQSGQTEFIIDTLTIN